MLEHQATYNGGAGHGALVLVHAATVAGAALVAIRAMAWRQVFKIVPTCLCGTSAMDLPPGIKVSDRDVGLISERDNHDPLLESPMTDGSKSLILSVVNHVQRLPSATHALSLEPSGA